MAGIARSRSASGITITGELAPSSMESLFMPAVRVIRSPVSTPPVNVTRRMRVSATSASPNSSPRPVTTLSLPGGRPASIRSCARRRAERGVAEPVSAPPHCRRPSPDRSCGDHRQRIVERRNGADDANRKAEVVPEPVLGPDPTVKRQRLAPEPLSSSAASLSSVTHRVGSRRASLMVLLPSRAMVRAYPSRSASSRAAARASARRSESARATAALPPSPPRSPHQ